MFFDAKLHEAESGEARARIRAGVNPIQAWREQRGLSVRDLAEAVDAPVALVLMLEAGTVPMVPDARNAFAKALGVPARELRR